MEQNRASIQATMRYQRNPKINTVNLTKRKKTHNEGLYHEIVNISNEHAFNDFEASAQKRTNNVQLNKLTNLRSPHHVFRIGA